MNNLFVAALDCLLCADPPRKAQLSADAARRAFAGEFDFDPAGCEPPRPLPEPGRPDRPHLVHPRHLVPRVLEARGLDVTPGMIARLEAVGDRETVAILRVILEDEVGHVAAGSRWFAYACDRDGLDPDRTFATLVAQHAPGVLRAPFNLEARARAGFSPAEIEALMPVSA